MRRAAAVLERSPAVLSLRVEPQPDAGGHTTIRVEGALTARTGARLRELVIELLGSGCVRLVVDVRGVGEIDAVGLGVLAGAARRAEQAGGCLHLTGRGGAVEQAVRRTGLGALLPVSDSLVDGQIDAASTAVQRSRRWSG